MTLEEKYVELCRTPGDIVEHLPTLKKYALLSDSVVELGVRYGVSTIALLSGKPKRMVSYDINPYPQYKEWYEKVKNDTNFEFIQANDLEIEIEPTDLIFVDTIHHYDQIKKELELHGNKAKKYIIFHDTSSFEFVGESYDNIPRKGIWPAIEEFLKDNPHWSILERKYNNNGLTILIRK